MVPWNWNFLHIWVVIYLFHKRNDGFLFVFVTSHSMKAGGWWWQWQLGVECLNLGSDSACDICLQCWSFVVFPLRMRAFVCIFMFMFEGAFHGYPTKVRAWAPVCKASFGQALVLGKEHINALLLLFIQPQSSWQAVILASIMAMIYVPHFWLFCPYTTNCFIHAYNCIHWLLNYKM